MNRYLALTVCVVLLLSGCYRADTYSSSEGVFNHTGNVVNDTVETAQDDYFRERIFDFQWLGFDNKPFLRGTEMDGNFCDIYLIDLNLDGINEIALVWNYPPRVIPLCTVIRVYRQ